MNLQNYPIGFFDSGVGGTSIWKEVFTLLPFENTVYLADSKHAPYGQKTKEEIVYLSRKNTELLLNLNAKLIVVACNTATTNAIQILRDEYPVPFIGIEPAIKPAGLITKTKKIGILATQGTLNSELFEKTSGKIDPEVRIIEKVGHGLVELVESGNLDSPEMHALLQSYIVPMLEEGIDALVLGCTHYPYLIPQIRAIVGNQIQIIDSGRAVAKQTKNILEKYRLLQTNLSIIPTHHLYSNSDTSILKNLIGVNSQTNILKKEF